MEGSVERARQAGQETIAALRRTIAQRTAELIRSDPDAAEAAVEVGLIDARWLDDPARYPNVVSPPGEVLERFLERAVAARPSRLGSLGLGAVQLLATLGPGRQETSVREVCVVFTDLEGFTAFTEAAGDQAALEVLTAHGQRSATTVRRGGGRIVKHLGDGLMCTFADPDSAVRAAADLVGAGGGPLRVRAGAHMGETLVVADDLVGHAVNVAARVTEEARGGQVLATDRLLDAAGPIPGLVYGPARTVRLKGIADSVALREVLTGQVPTGQAPTGEVLPGEVLPGG